MSRNKKQEAIRVVSLNNGGKLARASCPLKMDNHFHGVFFFFFFFFFLFLFLFFSSRC